jgi:hypothetical protein
MIAVYIYLALVASSFFVALLHPIFEDYEG